MDTKISIRRLLLVASVSTIVGLTLLNGFIHWLELKQNQYSSAGLIRELTELEQWKVYLLNEIYRNGLTYRDFRILNEVNRCESKWRQFWPDGSVVVSSGNIGIAQINKWAHEAEYTKLGLDIKNTFDNLTYQVLLYKHEGLKPWRKWSGWCWENKIPR